MTTEVYLSTSYAQPSEDNFNHKYSIQGTKLIVLDDFIKNKDKLHVAFSIDSKAKTILAIATVEIYFSHKMIRIKSENIKRANFKSPREKAARMKELDMFLEENRHLAK
jgi:hypothetical protein